MLGMSTFETFDVMLGHRLGLRLCRKLIKIIYFQHSKPDEGLFLNDPHLYSQLGEFTMVSQPIRLILVDWFVFHF